MFGLNPSESARKSLKIFKKKKFKNIIELGAGLGRDTIYFGSNNLNVCALDYSFSAIKTINRKIYEQKLSNVVTKVYDIREKLPFDSNTLDACFSHMLYCMALTSRQLFFLNKEIHRILKPGGLNIYTVRNEDDGDYNRGISRGENMYENDGFIVHFFSKKKVRNLLKGFDNICIERLEEGEFPRRLYFVVNKKH